MQKEKPIEEMTIAEQLGMTDEEYNEHLTFEVSKYIYSIQSTRFPTSYNDTPTEK